MPYRKLYFENMEKQDVFLEIFRNNEGNLFISVGEDNMNSPFICLSPKDAIQIISELAFAFDLIDDNIELEGKMMWKGDSR